MEVIWPENHLSGEDCDYTVDIVLIHGLRGDSRSTWIHPNGAFWPTNFLPRDLRIDRLRILSYSYSVDAFINESETSISRISTIAEALCSDLLGYRRNVNHPITFICHGIGGVVLKNALVYANARITQFEIILTSTEHVIFMDTPHLGFDSSSWSSTYDQVLNARGHRELGLWSSFLTELRRSFVNISSRFPITTYLSGLRDPQEAKKGWSLQEDSAVLGVHNEIIIVLDNESHDSMTKFASKNSVTYQRIFRRINKVETERREREEQSFALRKRAEKERLQDGIRQIRSKLYASNGANHKTHEDNLRNRWEGTCQWLLEHQVFKEWTSDSKPMNRKLWLFGGVGCGKTTICSVAIDYVRSSLKKPTIYLFLGYLSSPERLQLLRDITCQILDYVAELESTPNFSFDSLSFMNQSGSNPEHYKELIPALLSLIGPSYIFVDGLNEVGDPVLNKTSSATAQEMADVKAVLEFLIELANENTGNLKLWCSSQNAGDTASWVSSFEPLGVDTASVKDDIKQFIAGKGYKELIKTGKDTSPKAMLETFRGAGSNFKWASLMLDDIIRSVDEGFDEEAMNEMALRGLPRSLDEYYDRALQRLESMDKEDDWRTGKKRRRIRTMLSIVTFSKRSLSLNELIEAISCAEAHDPDLASDGIPDIPLIKLLPRRLQNRCKPLVDFVSTSDQDPDQGYFRLSHGSVVTFLRERLKEAMVQKVDTESYCVDPRIMANSCLRYLFQRRFSKLLVKKSATEFETASGQPIATQSFFTYCAKYWYRHLDLIKPTNYDKRIVGAFLESTQFITCIQVQSLFVIGHFVNNIDDEVIGRRSLKQNLPKWVAEQVSKTMPLSYHHFVGEWGTFLQHGITSEKNGEIDRCFWGALGPTNLLSRHTSIERYKSFEFRKDGTEPKKGVCFYDIISTDGMQVLVVMTSPNGKQRTQAECQLWVLDGSNDPVLAHSSVMDIPKDATNWGLYVQESVRAFPLMPVRGSTERAKPVDAAAETEFLRLGATQLSTQEVGRGDVLALQYPKPKEYYEHILVHGKYTAKTRRRLIKPQVNLPEPKKHKLVTAVILTKSKKKQPVQGDSTDESALESSDSEISVASIPDSSSEDESSDLESSDGMDGFSSPEEYWSAGSSDTGEEEDSEESSEDNPDSDTDDSSSDGEEDTLKSKSRSTKKLQDGVTGSDTETSEDSDSDFDTEARRAGNYPQVDRKAPSSLYCNGCHTSNIYETYQCRPCGTYWSWDVCSSCLDKGRWCKVKSHEMTRLTKEKGQWVSHEKISINDATPNQLLLVEKHSKTGPVTVFRYRSRNSTLLYDSPPVFHPKVPLVAWPLGKQRILYGDIGFNSFFTRPLHTITKRHEHISVQPKYSTCGRFLDIASFEALDMRRGVKKPGKRVIALYFHLVSYKLSKEKTAISPPKLISERVLSLGITHRLMVSKLPFTLTWREDSVYVTTDSRSLQIYRVPLDRGQGSKHKPAPITTLSEDIILPRSAKHRVVRFFPRLNGGENNLLVIGSRHCEYPAPPIGVYLNENRDLGKWIEVENSPKLQAVALRRRVEPLFEKFDADDDCDLIPYDPDFPY